MNLRKFGKISVLIILVAAPIIGWSQRWYLHDSYRLRNFTPDAQIVKLADNTTMVDSARRLFFVYHPKLNQKTEFNTNCHLAEKTIVLGCYVSGIGIFVYDVTDERLNGIMEVTAAHEMLHAAYERLSANEKTKINELLIKNYNNLDNERIKSTIDDYSSSGADTNNELHSILATEVRDLSPELEAYYSKYFYNRQKIVEYSEKYENAFTDRKQKISDYDARLADIKTQIDKQQSQLDALNAQIKADKSQLDAYYSAKDFSSYNENINEFNKLVNAYNSTVRSIRVLIDDFNSLVGVRNSVAAEQGELIKAIDSRPGIIDSE